MTKVFPHCVYVRVYAVFVLVLVVQGNLRSLVFRILVVSMAVGYIYIERE